MLGRLRRVLCSFFVFLIWISLAHTPVYADSDQLKFLKKSPPSLTYSVKGNGPPVILIHGLGASNFTWRKNIPVLSRNFTVYGVNLPGFGPSQAITRPYSFESLVESFEKFFISENLGQVFLVGHSLGGGISLAIAKKYPNRVKGLVLISSEGCVRSYPWSLRLAHTPVIGKPLYNLILPSVINWTLEEAYFDQKHLTSSVREHYQRLLLTDSGREALWNLMMALGPEVFQKSKNRLNGIQTPTLLIWGSEDHFNSLSVAECLHEKLPTSVLKVVPKGGHMLHEEQAVIINALIRNIFRSNLLISARQ